MPGRERTRLTRHDARWALVLGLAVLGVYLLTMGGHTYSVDDEGYMVGTRSLLNGRTVLQIDSTIDDMIARVPHKNGGETSIAPVGTLLLFAPMYVVGRAAALPFDGFGAEEVFRLVYLSSNAIFTAVTAGLLVLLSRSLGATLRSSMIVAAAFALGTWAWVHSQSGFSEPGTAMVLTATMLAAVHWWRDPSPRRAALVGFLAGCAVLTRPSVLLFVPVFALSGLVARPTTPWRARVSELLGFGAGGIVPALVFGINAYLRFGSPVDMGYSRIPYTTPWYEGAFGLLLSPGKGLLWYAPVCVVVLFGLRQAALRDARYVATVGALLAVHLYVYARFAIWSGENAFGPRYLVPLLPMVVAIAALLVDLAPHWRRGIVAAALVGLVVPGLVGTLVYFNGVYHYAYTHDPATPVVGADQPYNAVNFQPRTSPLLMQMRAIPPMIDNGWARLTGGTGGITEMPEEYELRIHWYARSPELDTWWAWWPAKNGPVGGYAFVLVPIACLVAAALLARRSLPIDGTIDADDEAENATPGATVGSR